MTNTVNILSMGNGKWKMETIEGVRSWKTKDPDTNRIWWRDLNKAIERRSIVLRVMYNQDYIDHQQYIENNSIIPDNIS